VTALTAARETLYQQRRDHASEMDPPTMEQQQADVLALLAETALNHGIDPGASGERYQVVVHVDAEVLADSISQGTPYSTRDARSSWNVAAAGMRCEPCRHAPRR